MTRVLTPGPPDGLYIHSLDDIEITDDPEADVRPAARRDTRRERREKNAPTRRQPKNEEQP